MQNFPDINHEVSPGGEALEWIWIPLPFTERTGVTNLRLIGNIHCTWPRQQENLEVAKLLSPVLTLLFLVRRKRNSTLQILVVRLGSYLELKFLILFPFESSQGTLSSLKSEEQVSS